MKKKLFCLVSLVSIFSLTSCDLSFWKNDEPPVEQKDDDNSVSYKDCENARIAYQEFKYDLSYDEFLLKLDVKDNYYDDYAVYKYSNLDICYAYIFKNRQKYACIKSEIGNVKHLKGYRYTDSDWQEVADINMQNNETSIKLNKKILTDEYGNTTELFSDYSFQDSLTYIINYICGNPIDFGMYIGNIYSCDIQNNYSVNVSLLEDNKETKRINYVFKKFLPLSVIEFLIDENNSWYINRKLELNYDEKYQEVISKKCYRLINGEFYLSGEEYTLDGVKIKKYVGSIYGYNDKVYTSMVEFTYEDDQFVCSVNLKYENNQWVPTSKYEYEYDNNGDCITEIKSYFINHEWIQVSKEKRINGNLCDVFLISIYNDEISSKREYEYDDKGRCIAIIYSYYRNNEWELYSKTEKSYDENGNVIALIKSSTFSNQLHLDSKAEYTYDENGQLLTITRSKYNNDAWSSYEKCKYEYDNKGTKTQQTTYSYINNEWIPNSKWIKINGKECTEFYISFKNNEFYSKTESKYNEKGNIILVTKFNYLNNEWVIDSKTEYVYDEDENEVLETTTKFVDGEWIVDSKEETTYTSNPGTKTTLRTKLVNGEWVPVSKYESKYAENSHTLIENTRSIYVDNKWEVVFKQATINEGYLFYTLISAYYSNDKLYTKREYEYDEKGHETLEIYSQYVNGEWLYSSKEEYEYDEKGNKTLEIYSKYVNGEWLYSSKEEYEYDENGKKVREVDSNYVNNKWIETTKKALINDTWKTVTLFYYDGDKFSSKCEYEYDEKGHKILELNFNYVENEWIFSSKYEYYYENLKTLEVYSNYVNNEWVYASKWERYYDEKVNLVKEICFDYKDNAWVYDSKTEYIVDENGNEIKLESKYIDDKWVAVTKYNIIGNKRYTEFKVDLKNGKLDTKEEYTYDESGKQNTITSYQYANNEWVLVKKQRLIKDLMRTEFSIILSDNKPYRKYEDTYDENGKTILSIESRYIDNKWIEVEKQSLVNGYLRPEFRIQINNGQFYDKYEYTYNEKGDTTFVVYFIYNNGVWIGDTKTEYLYENGKLLGFVKSKYKDNGWVFDYKEESKYENGKRVSYTESKYIDDKWMVVHSSKDINGSWCAELNIILDSDNKISYKWEYTYTPDGKHTLSVRSNYVDGSYVADTRIEYVYDENGTWISTIESRYINNSWEDTKKQNLINGRAYTEFEVYLSDGKLSSKYEYTRDNNCNVITEKYFKYVDGDWVLYRVTEYVRNGGVISQKTISRLIGDEWVVTFKARTINSKLLTELSITIVDGKLSHKVEYTYDENGNTLTHKEYNYADGEWVEIE